MLNDNCTGTICGAELSQGVPQAVSQGVSQGVSLSWRGWLEDGKRLISTEFARAFAPMLTWRRRAYTRRHLATLDARLLADVGLTRIQALKEAQKPFWVE